MQTKYGSQTELTTQDDAELPGGPEASNQNVTQVNIYSIHVFFLMQKPQRYAVFPTNTTTFIIWLEFKFKK